MGFISSLFNFLMAPTVCKGSLHWLSHLQTVILPSCLAPTYMQNQLQNFRFRFICLSSHTHVFWIYPPAALNYVHCWTYLHTKLQLVPPTGLSFRHNRTIQFCFICNKFCSKFCTDLSLNPKSVPNFSHMKYTFALSNSYFIQKAKKKKFCFLIIWMTLTLAERSYRVAWLHVVEPPKGLLSCLPSV